MSTRDVFWKFPTAPPYPTANSATYCPTADKDLVLSADLWQDPESPFKGMGIGMYPLLYNSPFLSLKLLLCPRAHSSSCPLLPGSPRKALLSCEPCSHAPSPPSFPPAAGLTGMAQGRGSPSGGGVANIPKVFFLAPHCSPCLPHRLL